MWSLTGSPGSPLGPISPSSPWERDRAGQTVEQTVNYNGGESEDVQVCVCVMWKHNEKAEEVGDQVASVVLNGEGDWNWEKVFWQKEKTESIIRREIDEKEKVGRGIGSAIQMMTKRRVWEESCKEVICARAEQIQIERLCVYSIWGWFYPLSILSGTTGRSMGAGFTLWKQIWTCLTVVQIPTDTHLSG